MAGFRTPLFVLGLSTSISEQASVRSMLAPWIGGASAPITAANSGIRSMLAFWIGGASSGIPEPELTIPTRGGGYIRVKSRNRLESAEEQALIALLAVFIAEEG